MIEHLPPIMNGDPLSIWVKIQFPRPTYALLQDMADNRTAGDVQTLIGMICRQAVGLPPTPPTTGQNEDSNKEQV